MKVGGTPIATDSSISLGETSVSFTTSDGSPTSAELQAAIATGGVVTVEVTNSDGTTVASAVGNPTLVVDYTGPTISNVLVLDVAMIVGNIVTATITTDSDAGTFTLTSGSIGGFTLGSLSKINDTTYTATFEITNGGVDVAAGADIPVANLVLTDTISNPSTAYVTAISQDSDSIDANAPSISTVSIPDVAMNVGDTVTATITTVSDADTFTLVSGTVGGFTLGSLSKSDNVTYTATFTITDGGTDVAAGADIPVANLVLADFGGSPSDAFTGNVTAGASA